MADLTSDVQFRITQTGAKELSQSLVDVDGKMKQVGQSTSNLTKFIREQRTENRQANFLFRESRDIIGSLTFATIALTSATGGSSKEVQKMNQVLTTGFSAFQATGFAMSALGIATGGVSTAIQATVGIGVALLSFFEIAKEKAVSFSREMLAVNDAFSLFNSNLSRRGKQAGGFSDNRLTSELNQATRNLSLLAPQIRESEVARNSEDEKTQKIAERNLVLLRSQETAEYALIAAIKAEIDIRSGQSALDELNVKRRRSDLDPLSLEGANAARAKDFAFMLKIRGTIQDINIQTGKRKVLEEQILKNDMAIGVEKFSQLQLANAMQSNLNSITAGFIALGIETDSWLGKLIGGLQTLVAIYEAIAAIQAIIGIFSFLSGGGAAPKLMPIGGGGMAGIGGGSGTTININQSFSAFDGQGLRKTFNKPEVRNAITSAINDAARKGKI